MHHSWRASSLILWTFWVNILPDILHKLYTRYCIGYAIAFNNIMLTANSKPAIAAFDKIYKQKQVLPLGLLASWQGNLVLSGRYWETATPDLIAEWMETVPYLKVLYSLRQQKNNMYRLTNQIWQTTWTVW